VARSRRDSGGRPARLATEVVVRVGNGRLRDTCRNWLLSPCTESCNRCDSPVVVRRVQKGLLIRGRSTHFVQVAVDQRAEGHHCCRQFCDCFRGYDP
jgi:hypothetical protein